MSLLTNSLYVVLNNWALLHKLEKENILEQKILREGKNTVHVAMVVSIQICDKIECHYQIIISVIGLYELVGSHVDVRIMGSY